MALFIGIVLKAYYNCVPKLGAPKQNVVNVLRLKLCRIVSCQKYRILTRLCLSIINIDMNMNAKHKYKIKSAIIKPIMLACFISATYILITGILITDIFITQAQAQSQEEAETDPLLIPEDLAVEQNGKVQFEELRIGGRLERLTVRHKNGVTEVYQNQRADSIWFAEENELGEPQNVRQWKLGGW